MSENPEVERLKRLRDRQLQARDPSVKDRKLQRTISTKHKRAARPFSLRVMWAEIPHRWKGLLYGVILGILLILIVPELWQSVWALPAAIIGLTFTVIMGFLLGNAMDARDSLTDLMQ
jgi:hypothetical protein